MLHSHKTDQKCNSRRACDGGPRHAQGSWKVYYVTSKNYIKKQKVLILHGGKFVSDRPREEG